MLFESFLNFDTVLALVLVLVWSIAAVLAARQPIHRSDGRGRARAWFLLILLGLGALLVIGRLVTNGVLGSFGYIFVADRVVVALPMIVVPAVLVVAWSVPRWRDHARRPSSQTRLGTFSPRAVVPIQMTALAALTGFVTAIISTIPRPLLVPALTLYTIYLVVAAGLWFAQSRRWQRASNAEPVRRPLPARALRAVAVTVVLALVVAGSLTFAARSTRLPATISMGEHGVSSHSEGDSHSTGGGRTISVTELTGPRSETPDRRFTLVAQETTIRLSSGEEVEAWTFNGQTPGPELRMKRGELVEITVVNNLPKDNVAVHWHGVDVPNAEDGVAGVTQDAIEPGGSYVYRFRPDEIGTHWYHSHQQSSLQVRKGLFGPLIIDPADPADPAAVKPGTTDVFVSRHMWYDENDTKLIDAIGTSDQLERRTMAPGTPVRLRLLNSDSLTHRYSLTGVPFKVVAIDGNPINEPTDVTGKKIVIGGGGRYDVEFVMPDQPVRLTELRDLDGGLLFSPDGSGDVRPEEPEESFDPTTYGSPAPTPFDRDSRFDKERTLLFDNEFWFYNGRFNVIWASNGRAFPDVPHITVRENDLVKLRFANRSRFDHPMHLHGHTVLVLSRNGKPVTGSPLWLDTVNVEVGEVWEVAFRADNPGIWADHCHNLEHAKAGMMTHLAYEGVTTPYEVGEDTPNVLE